MTIARTSSRSNFKNVIITIIIILTFRDPLVECQAALMDKAALCRPGCGKYVPQTSDGTCRYLQTTRDKQPYYW
jgi:hypothetical protein